MKILVTGATGFLGGNLCRALEQEGHELVRAHSKNCDLTREESLLQWNGECFDQIFHLAAWTQAGDFCIKHPGEQWLINQKINTHVLQWWKERQPQAKLIAMGTSCSYDPALPLIEDNYMQGQPIESLYFYAMTKRMLLCGLQGFNKQFGLDYLYVVPSTLYGQGYQIKEGKQLHFIFDLVVKIVRGKLYGTPVVLWGHGHQKRELVHVDDFVRTLLELNQKEKNQIFNIGEGREHSIREFAQILCDIVGFPFEKIEFDLSRYVGATSKVLVNDRLLKVLPHYRPRSLVEGLKEIAEWYLEQEAQHVY